MYVGVLVEREILQIGELTVSLCSRSRIYYLLILSHRAATVKMHLVKNEHKRSAVLNTGFVSCWFPV